MREYLYNLATDKKKGFILSPIKGLLFLLALLYGFVIRVLALFCGLNMRRIGCKVISIGNITLGGTGKTVLVEYIARCLRERGHKVAVITRGYKRKPAGFKPPAANYRNTGDEPFMLSRNLVSVPVIVDSNRVKAAQKAIKDYSVDTVILDDAFQQWGIKKDLNILTIDASNPFGNRNMIPRGILREPLSALKRADVFMLTKTNIIPAGIELKDYLNKINPEAVVFESSHRPESFYKIDEEKNLLSIDAFKGKNAALFSGIGDPDSFTKLVMQLGVKVESVFKYPDHYNYTQQDLDKIVKLAKVKGVDFVLTTQKDAVRLSDLRFTDYDLQLMVLRIGIEIKDEERFINRLLRVYSL